MEQQLSQLVMLLDNRLQALSRLAQEIAAGQEAFVALDIAALQKHDLQKERLCTEVRRLDLEIIGLLRILSPGGSLQALANNIQDGAGKFEMETARRIKRLVKDSEAARNEVNRLNGVYSEFLRCSRQTLNILMNVMSHCLGIYPSPGFSGLPFERSY